ncbi:MAG: NAD(P)H-dependent oxidoreductase [Acidobacteriota bacterium]
MSARLLVFAGSLRIGSYNKRLARLAASAARNAGAEVIEIDLRDYPLPIFDEDLESEQGLPEQALQLKTLFKRSHGLIVACPEYNSSITAVLKNAIDWVSRPAPGERAFEPFEGKVAGLLSASPGALGGMRGLVVVRMLLSNLRMLVLPDQLSVSNASQAFDDSGALKDARQSSSLDKLAQRVVEVASRLN